MLAILVMILGLMLLPNVGQAVPMSQAFSYQGRLMDANSTADGLYDLQFKLYDDSGATDGNCEHRAGPPLAASPCRQARPPGRSSPGIVGLAG